MYVVYAIYLIAGIYYNILEILCLNNFLENKQIKSRKIARNNCYFKNKQKIVALKFHELNIQRI